MGHVGEEDGECRVVRLRPPLDVPVGFSPITNGDLRRITANVLLWYRIVNTAQHHSPLERAQHAVEVALLLLVELPPDPRQCGQHGEREPVAPRLMKTDMVHWINRLNDLIG